jgi:hypothetical protein
VSIGGALLAALLVAGFAPALILPVLWVAFLSLAVVCRDFLSYQWDALLLEAGLLALPLGRLTFWDRPGRALDPPRLARWLLWWLAFRLMFGSGLVKLASGDPTWQALTALAVHYETQPLPTPLAWYASRLPMWFHMMSTAMVLAIELLVPWLIFVSGRLRRLSAASLIALQCLIALTGNYAFFNLLSIALCVMLLDDDAIRSVTPHSWWKGAAPHGSVPTSGRWLAWAVSAIIAVPTFPASIVTFTGQMGLRPPLSLARAAFPLMNVVEPLRSVNPYGLFAVMTTTRSEIVVEGSNDGVNWLPYEFFDKVGDERRRPTWVAPFQPRLDWQMWFAALGQYDQEAWFQRFCQRLLEGSPAVLRLLARDPFEGKAPRLIRSTLYQYRFAGAAAHFRSGIWWTRERLGPYSPVLSLR